VSGVIGKIRDRLAASGIAGLAALAPRGAARALERYIDRIPPLMLLAAALRRAGIDSITVHGEQGVFTGSASDAAVIQRYALERRWSAETLEAVRGFFGARDGGTYLDIGANIGLTAIPVAASGIDVIAFEPVPQNHAYLLQNIAANGVARRIRVENVALMDRAGEIVMELSPANHGDHRVRRGGGVSLMREDNWATTVVAARPLDDWADRVPAPLALKIDTQGAEPFVIAGGPRICALAELAIVEFSPYSMNRMQSDPAVILDYLRPFAQIAIYEAENARPLTTQTGSAAVAFLKDYDSKFRIVPKGRYLNLIARR
jgi:FkbM family methyltransferase